HVIVTADKSLMDEPVEADRVVRLDRAPFGRADVVERIAGSEDEDRVALSRRTQLVFAEHTVARHVATKRQPGFESGGKVPDTPVDRLQAPGGCVAQSGQHAVATGARPDCPASSSSRSRYCLATTGVEYLSRTVRRAR